ncbi:MAG: hypothetical protein ABSG03_11135 [Bryobacteraceae bacterium]|jgi:hypothetical protein
MATPKQSAANRANAQNSSGPRTTAGKATSRFNALKHGIYAVHQITFDEKAEDLAELAAEYHEHHRPADADQRFLVDTLVHNEWRLRRTRRVEANLWYHAYHAFVVKNIEVTLTCTSGDAFATDSYTFERLQRIVNSYESGAGASACQPRCSAAAPATRSRTHACPTPATQTIEIHFREFGFVPSKSENPGSRRALCPARTQRNPHGNQPIQR